MFEFGRELRRLLGGEPIASVYRDGLTGGDSTLLELLDLRLLVNEARGADVAAGRLGNRDRGIRLLEAAVAWREVARRSGEATALRKAASSAEAAAKTFREAGKASGVARAKAEQGLCALLGAELFGDEGLVAAAERVLGEAAGASGVGAAMASAALAGVRGRAALDSGDNLSAIAARFEAPLAALTAAGRASPAAKLMAAEHRLVRADLLALAGASLREKDLIDHGLREAAAAVAGLDPAIEPLTWARARATQGAAQALLAELTGDVGAAADGVDALASALEQVARDHSPLDWARIQAGLGQALITLGEVSDNPRAFEQAVTCFDRADLILKEQPALALRAQAAGSRAMALGRQAELTGDLAVLDVAVAALKTELCRLKPGAEPVAWAVAQMNLARLYETRADITGKDEGGLKAASVALATAMDVFAEEGMRTLTDMAHQALERLRTRGAPA
ncbi:MAG: hypothetical protein Q8L23_12275 [Caulobacter sp.]|nr:hypothetical protein [Caulobacter sp.]